MRQKTINLRNQGSFDKKFDFFPDPKSHTQVGSLSAKNASEKFSRLGTFKVLKKLCRQKIWLYVINKLRMLCWFRNRWEQREKIFQKVMTIKVYRQVG